MKFFKWFYPGIGIKRWIFLCTVGLFLIVLVALFAVKSFSKISIILASFATALLIFGIFLVITAIKNIMRMFFRTLAPQRDGSELVDLMHRRRQERFLERGPRVVAIGGGTGLSMLLHGLKEYTSNISAIVTVTDTGGSSGRLRSELDILPPGDIRNCLVALADAEPLVCQLFQYRFEDGSGLKGHNFGNLFITALSKITGDFERAIKESSKVLAIRGSVIPSTLDKVTLIGEFRDGVRVEGETNITDRAKPLKSITLAPTNCQATKEALDAIENADLIIYGPGSLYTSVLPNVLIEGLLKKILESDAYKYYVSNVMTQPGETDALSAYEHLKVLIDHTDPRLIDAVFVNTTNIPPELIEKYKTEGAQPVLLDVHRIRAEGYEVMEGDMVKFGEQVRHDPTKLAHLIFNRFLEKKASYEGQTA